MKKPDATTALVWIGATLFFVLGALLAINAYKGTERSVEGVLLDKGRVCTNTGTGNGSGVECYYLIYTDQGTFELGDSFIYGRFSSSDIYGRLREDRRYRFDVAGFRVPVMSMYPKVVSDPREMPR
jgi:hypothetical protein